MCLLKNCPLRTAFGLAGVPSGPTITAAHSSPSGEGDVVFSGFKDVFRRRLMRCAAIVAAQGSQWFHQKNPLGNSCIMAKSSPRPSPMNMRV